MELMDKHVVSHHNGNYEFRIREDLPGKIKIENYFDIGCNAGETIKSYMGSFKPKRIYGFEPGIEMFNHVKRRMRHFPEIEIFNLALSDFSCDGKLYRTKLDTGYSILVPLEEEPTLQTVKIMRFDEWAKAHNITNFDLVKIDTQGNDFRVIKGMGELLRQVKILKAEVWFYDDEYKDIPLFDKVMSHMYKYGFVLYNFPTLIHHKNNRIAWGDAIFVRKDIIERKK